MAPKRDATGQQKGLPIATPAYAPPARNAAFAREPAMLFERREHSRVTVSDHLFTPIPSQTDGMCSHVLGFIEPGLPFS